MLLTGSDLSAYLFKQKIRIYNSVLAFTSIGTQIDDSITGMGDIYSFCIHDNRRSDSRRYNVLMTSEVIMIMVGNRQEIETSNHDIVLHLHTRGSINNDELISDHEEEVTTMKDVMAINYFISPSVLLLQVHLFRQHRVLFRDDSTWEYLAETASNETSTLTAWFKANSDYPNCNWENVFCLSNSSEDIHFHTNNNSEHLLTEAEIHNLALFYLQSILCKHSKLLADFSNMPIPITLDDTNSLISEEQNYDIDKLTNILKHEIFQLNEDQLTIFNKVINIVESKNSSIFFIDSPGKTGKTFLYK
ncbi:5811_t:CDS:2 [Cetraspora pellucida]|uniref:5811_t:CDS:1 n=1 Tax=Cetraspora pellucida TaxID=1433469 RepID=A0A9N9NH08_9GLOM|nr:5811_t:CDS:2 [Cetraspora pellucida]